MQGWQTLVAPRRSGLARAVRAAALTLFLGAALISGCTAALDSKAEADAAMKQGIDKLNKGDHLGAVEDLTRAITLRPTAEAYYHRSNARQELNNYKGQLMI